MVRSSPHPRCKPPLIKYICVCVLFWCLCIIPTVAGEQPALTEATPLQLEVLINGQPAQILAAFFQLPDSQIAAKRSELIEIGIKTTDGPPGDIIPLSEIGGIKYTYNIPRQAIDITVPDALRISQVINAATNASFHQPQRTTGAYLNYTAFLSGDYGPGHSGGQFDGGSVSLDGNIFGDFGTFSQSAIIGTSTFQDARVLRLDTTWSYSDPKTIMSYRAGDLIAGGLAWTRPIRVGGIQTQRNFSIRPDLITLPLPSLSGSAAVPSTLDVYLGNVKTYSAEVPSGPYQINNIPVVSGAGTARLVMTDATGRQFSSESAFFTDARLLREGLIDYSVEVGFPRLNYGLSSSTYDSRPVIIGSGQIGLTNQVTLQSHTELGDGLTDLGGGVVVSAGAFGLFSSATSFSHYGTSSGVLFYGAWDYPTGVFNLHASTERAIGDYRDLASLPINGGASFPRAIDETEASYHFPNSKSSLSVGALHAQTGPDSTMILNTSFDTAFENGVTIFATGFRDVDKGGTYGAFVGLTIPLGESATASVGATSNNSGTALTGDIDKYLGSEPGSVGGNLAFNAGNSKNKYVTGYGVARLNEGVLEGSIIQRGTLVNANATFDGALVVDGGSVFASQRITDAFVVIDAGAPGVKVLRENQPVGVTDSSGKLLVTGINAYQENKISIDAADLPINADVPITVMNVVPAERSGAIAAFGIQKSLPSAEVIFTRPDGSFIDPGTRGVVQNTNQAFTIGYDGRAFVRNLSDQNTTTINLKEGPCQAKFAFVPDIRMPTIGPVVCQ